MKMNIEYMDIRSHLKIFVANLLRLYVGVRYGFKRNAICFIPHEGMMKYDLYDIFNYKSDNALSFAHYLLENNLEEEAPFYFVVSDRNSIERLSAMFEKKYPNKEFEFVPLFNSFIVNPKDAIPFQKAINRSKYVFTSITYQLKGFTCKKQKLIDLNYFTVPFKNDIYSPSDPLYMKLDRRGHEYFAYVCTSELAIRVIMPTMTLPYSKFLLLGMCRNDNLIAEGNDIELRKRILSTKDYFVDKIILYTPTHRDYESKKSDELRFLLGFPANISELDSFLKNNHILILCKLHPKQNKKIINHQLPSSIMVHHPNREYGLTELMRISDGLITDYTSGYFDYLLLDKPVIFNFYDVEKYKATRGFSYNPIESITAGEIIHNVETFKEALLNIDINKEKYAEMRRFVRNLFHTYQDTNNCERVYTYFFNSQK